MPPKSGTDPLKRGSLSSAIPPSWAMASTMSTPGNVGRPGKWPAKKGSSPVSLHTPLALLPGSMAVTSSTNKKGGRCGSTCAGLGQRLAPFPLFGPSFAPLLNGPSPSRHRPAPPRR